MNIYVLTQDTVTGYDTFRGAVVIAEDEEAARNTLPEDWADEDTWAKPEDVKAELIGKAEEGREAGSVMSDFSAG